MHVTVVRSGRLGDVALILPAVRRLQGCGHQVAWLIGKDAHRLVSDITDIDWHVLVGGINTGREIYNRLPRDTRFVVLEPPGIEAGYAVSRSINPVKQHPPGNTWTGPTHALERYWEYVTGSKPVAGDQAHWRLPIEPVEPEPFLLVNLCASTADRDWNVPEGYATIFACARSIGLDPLVVHAGSGRERVMLEAIRRHYPVNDHRCDLPELLRLITAAAVLITPDSGPAHLAGITGTPVIGLYGPTTLWQWGPYWSRQWSLHAQRERYLPVEHVIERLHRLAAAGFPRCGGEGALLC